MNEPDFERMTKDEVVSWFRTTNDLSPMLVPMTPATDPVARPAPEVPMMLASIRLPVVLVEQLDNISAARGVRRSDVIRDALNAYVVESTSPVGRNEAERALDVLRRIISGHPGPHGRAAASP